MHDLKDGCSRFSCDCLYETQDGTRSIASILMYHPAFEQLRFSGKTYRGMVLSKTELEHYKEGSSIVTTTILSTSKDRDVARMFSDPDSNSTADSFICTYEIISESTALDISSISEYGYEQEVVILPYSAFLIKSIEEDQNTTIIYLVEQPLYPAVAGTNPSLRFQ